MNTAYEASPECAERQCKVTRIYDIEHVRHVFQHGDNPEAVMFLSRLFYGTAAEAAANARDRFRDFAERCHRYDDGETA